MIKVDGIKLTAEELVNAKSEEDILAHKLAQKLRVAPHKIKHFTILKKSVDARKKPAHLQYSVAADLHKEESVMHFRFVKKYQEPVYQMPKPNKLSLTDSRPVVIGFGPAGIFCAYLLASAGLKPLIFERGDDVDTRSKKVMQFWQNGELDTESNVQFGEGGAGTFSDGKLSTNLRDARCRFILKTLIEHDAPAEILYQSKPHIGTDILRKVVRNMRENIIAMGGEIHFHKKLTNLDIHDNKLAGIYIDNKYIHCDNLFLGLGHSARDTFAMLAKRGLTLSPKPFAVGVRIEHSQAMINDAQFGTDAFGAADYKLAYHGEERSVYSFCMCPGGMVVAAASENGGVVTNGMSYYKRNLANANSALLVEVKPSDLDGDNILAGIEFQRKYERLAFDLAGGNYNAPVQTVGGFMKSEIQPIGAVKPSYTPNYTLCQLEDCLPDFVTHSLREAIPYFGQKIVGFDSDDAVMTAFEARSSSPIRIVRDENLMSNIKGIYPMGEGAGYAGGIMSAAIDGMKCATAYLERL